MDILNTVAETIVSGTNSRRTTVGGLIEGNMEGGDVNSFENSESRRIEARFQFWLDYNGVRYREEDDDFKDSVGCFSYELPQAEVAEKCGQAVYFMDNWVATYNCLLVQANLDDFGIRAPLFKAATDFFFNKYILLIITILSCYCILLNLIQIKVDKDDKGVYSMSLFFNLTALIYCIWGRVLYKGAFFSHNTIHRDDHRHDRAFDVHREEVGLMQATYNLGAAYMHTFVYQVKASARHVKVPKLFKNVDAPTMGGAGMELQPASFVGVSAKQQYSEIADALDDDGPALIDPNENPLMNIDISKRVILETGFLPVGSGFYETLNAAVKYIVYCIPEHSGDVYSGKQFKFRFLTSLLILVAVIMVFVCAMFQWILQIIEIAEVDPDCGKQCDAQRLYFNLSGAGIIPFLQGMLLFSNVAVIYAGLFLASDTADALCRSWMKRFSGLRRMPNAVDVPDHGADDDSARLKKLLKLEPSIRRDAYERYLYIRHFMAAASREWSPLLVLIFANTVFTGIMAYDILEAVPIWKWRTTVPLLSAMLGQFLLFVYPLYCLAYANIRVNLIRNTFYNCAPGDFASIGGVAEWTAFMSANTIYWNVMGIPITIEMIQSWGKYLIGIIPVVLGVLKGAGVL